MTKGSGGVFLVGVLYLNSIGTREVDCSLCAIYPTSVPGQPIHIKYHIYTFCSQHNQFRWKRDSTDLYRYIQTCEVCSYPRSRNLHAHDPCQELGLHPTSIHKRLHNKRV